MKNKIKLMLLFLIIMFGCSGCDGNITRNIRHAGFSLSNTEFVCDELVPDKDLGYEKIKYFSNTFAITDDGKIYDLSLEQKYSNEKNCKKADFDLKVVSIFDNKVVKADDDKYYYLSGQTGAAAYSLVTVNDNNYNIYNLLLGADDVLKVMTVNQGSGTYYVLKDDGNVYSYVITRRDYQSNYSVVSKKIVYNKKKYGKIIDFNEALENPSTYVRTKDEIYRMQITNKEKCSKYADVTCKYKMKKDNTLTEYNDRILAYNGNLLITTYQKEFSVSN